MDIREWGKWNARASIVYALGVWAMLGSVGYLKYTGRLDAPPASEKKEEEVEERVNPNVVTYESGNFKSIIIYKDKENWVPYTTRIYNFIKSFSAEEPGTGHDK